MSHFSQEKVVAFPVKAVDSPEPQTRKLKKGLGAHTHAPWNEECTGVSATEGRIRMHLCVSACEWDPCRNKREGEKRILKYFNRVWAHF